jgi:hypothetical protein
MRRHRNDRLIHAGAKPFTDFSAKRNAMIAAEPTVAGGTRHKSDRNEQDGGSGYA